MKIGNIEIRTNIKARGFLETEGYTSGLKVRIPVLIAAGRKKYPILSIVANQHGREINGIEVIRRLFEELKVKELKGMVICIPVANPLAVRIRQQNFPDEFGKWVKSVPSLNMNRVWPGEANGNIIERMTYIIFNQAIKISDCVIDLHGWTDMSMPLICTDKKDKKLAKIFGHRIFLLSDFKKQGAKCLDQICAKNNIPVVLAELPPQNRLSEESIAIGLRGIKNIMCHMGISKGKIELPNEQFYIKTKEHILRAEYEGLFVPLREKGKLVKKRDRLGIICSLETLGVIQKINSPINGILFNKGPSRFEACPESNIVSKGENICIVKQVYKA